MSWRLLWVKYCAECLLCVMSFNLYKKPDEIFIIFICIWGNKTSSRLIQLPQIRFRGEKEVGLAGFFSELGNHALHLF